MPPSSAPVVMSELLLAGVLGASVLFLLSLIGKART